MRACVCACVCVCVCVTVHDRAREAEMRAIFESGEELFYIYMCSEN